MREWQTHWSVHWGSCQEATLTSSTVNERYRHSSACLDKVKVESLPCSACSNLRSTTILLGWLLPLISCHTQFHNGTIWKVSTINMPYFFGCASAIFTSLFTSSITKCGTALKKGTVWIKGTCNVMQVTKKSVAGLNFSMSDSAAVWVENFVGWKFCGWKFCHTWVNHENNYPK